MTQIEVHAGLVIWLFVSGDPHGVLYSSYTLEWEDCEI